MRKFTLPIAVPIAMVAGLAAPHALAADMPLKAPPRAAPPPAAFTWNGCYAGIHGGYGWGKNRNEFGSVIDGGEADHAFENGNYSHNLHGGLAGIQYGCNSQWTNWVLGIENEWFFSGMKGSATTPEDRADPGLFTQLQTKNRWDSTLALRLGYAVDRSLFYGKVGVAWGRFDYVETHDDFPGCNSTCTFTDKQWEAGLMLGAGWEYAFYNNWSIKFEYDHIWFQTDDVLYPNNTCGTCNTLAAHQSFHATNSKDLVKVGINYMFPVGGILGVFAPH